MLILSLSLSLSLNPTVLCNQQPDTSSCGGIEEKQFFYNARTQCCERFVYGGCEESDNRFSSLRECARTCRGVTDLCSDTSCPRGSRCRVDLDTGTPFCQPSCEYENGGCAADEICRLEEVNCVKAPCPPQVICHSREGTKNSPIIIVCSILELKVT